MLIKMERINLGLAIMVDGVTKMHVDEKMAVITYDTETMIYTIIGKNHGHVTFVHYSNVSWSRPLKVDDEQKSSSARSSRAN